MKIAKIITVTQLVMITFVACKTKDTKNEDNSSDHHHHPTDVNAEQYSEKGNNGTIKTDTLNGSPKRSTVGFINGIHVHIVYGSPRVKGRRFGHLFSMLKPNNTLLITTVKMRMYYGFE